jgi:lysophospholipase L1-like esterase
MPEAGFEYGNAANFVSYADYVAQSARLTLANGSCPGEASGSFLSADSRDLGCRDYRANVPLHVAYTGTQAEFAAQFVRDHRDTRLVTIQLGANDLFLLQERCFGTPTCIAAALPATLAILEQNILATISSLRDAGYRRTIVVVNYYPLNLNDTAFTALTQALNAALADAAAQGGAIVADAFTAFSLATAAAPASGNSCIAGLLKANPFDQQSCDIHPSQSGHRLIADAIARAVRNFEGRDH